MRDRTRSNGLPETGTRPKVLQSGAEVSNFVLDGRDWLGEVVPHRSDEFSSQVETACLVSD